ncbi:uncharacterized protein [Periplaneta americana]|uniref:uncharacterized protein isoform X2 n=1 Tax=Periplaneta americana TaxID=6978 RepID=UPI0037E97D14
MVVVWKLPDQFYGDDEEVLAHLLQMRSQIDREIMLRQQRIQRVNESDTNRPAQRSDTGRHTQPNVSNYQQQSEDEVRRVQPLPDLVLSTVSGQAPRSAAPEAPVPVPPPRRRASDVDRDCPQPPPRRPRRRRCSSCRGARISWMQIGKELRKIADEFRTGSHLQDDASQMTEEDNKKKKKEESLLSLLVPSPFRGPVWTAVILLVGWRLLTNRD